MNKILKYGHISDQQDSENPLKRLLTGLDTHQVELEFPGFGCVPLGYLGPAFATDGGGTSEGRLPPHPTEDACCSSSAGSSSPSFGYDA